VEGLEGSGMSRSLAVPKSVILIRMFASSRILPVSNDLGKWLLFRFKSL
jgi:hypothetical protein